MSASTVTEGTPLSAALAQMAMVQATLPEVANVIAYAEGFGLTVGTLGVAMDPLLLVRKLVDETILGRRLWHADAMTFPTHLKRAVQGDLAVRVWHRAEQHRAAGRVAANDVRMSRVQMGSVGGVLEAAHFLGEMLGSIRARDESMRGPAAALTDLLQSRLLAAIDLDGSRATGRADDRTAAPRASDDEPTPPMQRRSSLGSGGSNQN